VGDETICSIYIEAGAAFNLNVTAKAWQAIGEINSDFCDNATTANFVLSDINLSSNLIAPTAGTGGVNGSLGVSLTAIATGGTVSQSETFTEVGVFSFTASPSLDYFGETIAASTSVNVGRFIPHHFKVVPSGTPIIFPGTGYHYLGQPFTLAYDIQAVGLNDSTITTNYDGVFNFLNVDTQITYGAVDTVAPYSFNNNSRLTVTAASAAWLDGVATMSVPVTIERDSAVDGPYTTTDIGVEMIDDDSVQTRVVDYDLDADLDTTNERIKLATIPGELRYGRTYFPPVISTEINISGTETTNIPFEIQYWHGNDFVSNTDDNASSYSAWALTCADPLADTLDCLEVALNTATGTVINGNSDPSNEVTLGRPGGGNTGPLDITVTVDDWLKFDWFIDLNGDGTDDDSNIIDPQFRMIFGSYRGHDRIIYWREAE
jgi:MSHA biogenesis protein MshQ